MARRRSGKKIDFTHWTGFAGGNSALAAGSSAQTLLAAQHLPETLMRTRGNLLAYVDGAGAPGRLARVAMGMILVPEGTGTTVLWDPESDSDASWFWYTTFCIGYEEAVVDVVDVAGLSIYRETIDSRAMRIVKNQEVQLVTVNTTVGSALVINTCIDGRWLSGT